MQTNSTVILWKRITKASSTNTPMPNSFVWVNLQPKPWSFWNLACGLPGRDMGWIVRSSNRLNELTCGHLLTNSSSFDLLLRYGKHWAMRILPNKQVRGELTYDPYLFYICTQVLSRLARLPVHISVWKTFWPLCTPFDSFFIKLFFFQHGGGARLTHLWSFESLFYHVFLSVRFLKLETLISFIRKTLHALGLFRHKFFLTNLFNFIKNYFQPYFHLFNCSGIFIGVKGKIGLTGDARKRRLFINLGKTSRFRIKNRVVHRSETLVTKSGVLGLTIWYFYE